MQQSESVLSSLPVKRKRLADFSRRDLLRAEDTLTPCLVTDAFDCFPQWQACANDMAAALCEEAEEGESSFAECSANDHLPGIATPRYYGGERFLGNEDPPPPPPPERSSSSTTVPASTSAAGNAVAAPQQRRPHDALPIGKGHAEHGLVGPRTTPADGTPIPKKSTDGQSSRVLSTPISANPLFTAVGGIDIMDNMELRRGSLLSLQVAALQARKEQQRQPHHQRHGPPRTQLDSTPDHLAPLQGAGTAHSLSVHSASMDDFSVDSTLSEPALSGSATGTTNLQQQQRTGDSASGAGVGHRRQRKQPVLSLRDARQILRERWDAAESSTLPSPQLLPSAKGEGARAREEEGEETSPSGLSSQRRSPREEGERSSERKSTPVTDALVSSVMSDGNARRSSTVNDSFSICHRTSAAEAAELHAALRNESGCLYVKAPLSPCTDAMDALALVRLTFPTPDAAPHASAPSPAGPDDAGGHIAHTHRQDSVMNSRAQSFFFGNSLGDSVNAFPSHNYFIGADTSISTLQQQMLRMPYHRGPSGLPPFHRELPVDTAVASPLLLRPGAYCAFVMLAECGAGTRAHVNVNDSHAWHALLSGRKEWVVVHPLDKHLVMDEKSGEFANLFHVDHLRFPHARHARVYHFTQEAGQAVFVPADAVHAEITIAPAASPSAPSSPSNEEHHRASKAACCSVAVLLNFMDASNYMSFLKQTRANTILQSPRSTDSLLPEIMHITTVDLVLFDDNVYPSFRGTTRRYRPQDAVQVLVLRSMTEFSQIRMPCSELGARLELEALQSCFSFLGEAMLNEYDPPRYVVGVPKGYLVSTADHHLTLYYFVEPYSLQQIREALSLPHIQRRQHRYFQYYERAQVTLPAVHFFRSTVSHHGRVPNYVPLAVLFNQLWPFERDLCRSMVNLPHIILEKTYHPLGFIRPGSVWHYSRFDVKNRPAVLATTCEGESPNTNGGCEEEEGEEDDAAAQTGDEHGERSSFERVMKGNQSLEDQPGNMWCRTFLFYCSPLLNKPVTLHPLSKDSMLQTAAAVAESSNASTDDDAALPSAGDAQIHRGRQHHRHHRCRGVPPTFTPRILEFAWNANQLEEYGMVSLLQFQSDFVSEIKRKILTHPSFPRFEAFVQKHCMQAIDHAEEANTEKVMAVVLWFMCRPGVVGFTFGSAHDPAITAAAAAGMAANHDEDTHDEAYSPDGEAQRRGWERQNNDHDSNGRSPFLRRTRGSSYDCTDFDPSATQSHRGSHTVSPSVAPSTSGFTSPGLVAPTAIGEEKLLADGEQWDTVCLTATAASAFLSCVACSSYASVATRLCNWLCDLPEEGDAEHEESLFDTVEDILRHGDAEEQAVVFEVLKIKERTLATKEEEALSCAAAVAGHRGDPVDQRTCGGVVNKAKLAAMRDFCHRIESCCAEDGHVGDGA